MGARKLIDINKATSEELAAIPGIGRELAQEIVSIRHTKGPICNFRGLSIIPAMSEDSLAILQENTTIGQVRFVYSDPLGISGRRRLYLKFVNTYDEHADLIATADELIKEAVEALNPGYDTTGSIPTANRAYEEYVAAVSYAVEALAAHPEIDVKETFRIRPGERITYDLPVLLCRRFELGADATFVVGSSINPTIIIISEEIDVDPTARWEWAPRHPILATPTHHRAADGFDYDINVYTPSATDEWRGASGEDGTNGVRGLCPDDYNLAPAYGACEGPTVQIIALRILSLPILDLNGQDGAPGGAGQDGGHGGDGARGKRSRVARILGIPYCDHEPGSGGSGGDGGDGGPGGRGGRGGDGGSLRLFTTAESWQALIEGGWALTALISGGRGGARGPGGIGGLPGTCGRVGRADSPCQESHARRGFDGQPGQDGPEGTIGVDGAPGLVEHYVITAFDFDLIRDMPYIHHLSPDSGPTGTEVYLYGHNLEDVRSVEFSAVTHLVAVQTGSAGRKYFTVPSDALSGWATVRIVGGEYTDPLGRFDIYASVLDFMVIPHIDNIFHTRLPDRAIWIDEFTLEGSAFSPSTDEIQIALDGESYDCIIDQSSSTQTSLHFHLPQISVFVDHPEGEWEVTVTNLAGYRSNSVVLGLHSCRAIPFRPMPLYPNHRPRNYPYWPNGFYFENFSEGLPDWDLFLDTYGAEQISSQIPLDLLWSSLYLALLPAITPGAGFIPGASLLSAVESALLTIPSSVGPYYVFWHCFLNGVIPAAHCSGMSTVALLDYLASFDCFLRPWNGADLTARRRITAATARLLSRETLLDQVYPQCILRENSIPEAVESIREALTEDTLRDRLPLLSFIPSGVMTDLGFWQTIVETHTVVPYMIIDDIETDVRTLDASGAWITVRRAVTRVYVYDPNRPFAPYSAFDPATAPDTGADRNALYPHPSTWDALLACPFGNSGPPFPCFSTTGPNDTGIHFISVWNAGTEADPQWRFDFDDLLPDGTPRYTVERGFTLGWEELRHFSGDEYVTLPLKGPIGFVPQVLQLLLSPATVQLHRVDRTAARHLGEALETSVFASPPHLPTTMQHELHYVPDEERNIAHVIRGSDEGGTYSYRRFDHRLDVSVLNMPISPEEEDVLITESDVGRIEIHTTAPITKYGSLLVQRESSNELHYALFKSLALSAEHGIDVVINDDMSQISITGGVPGRRCDLVLYRLTKDGTARQHRTQFRLGGEGVSVSFENWTDICDEEISFVACETTWILRDRIDMSARFSGIKSRQDHSYIRLTRDDQENSTMRSTERAYTTRRAIPWLTEGNPKSCQLGENLTVECFTIKNLVPTLPIKVMHLIPIGGSVQKSRVYVNGQRISRYDWLIKGHSTDLDSGRYADSSGSAKKDGSGWFWAEFIIPASYVTANEISIRIETYESDFPLDVGEYEFHQNTSLTVVEIPGSPQDLFADVVLSSGRKLPLKTLVDMSKDRKVSIAGIGIRQTIDRLEIDCARIQPGRPSYEVVETTRDDQEQLIQVLLSNGEWYAPRQIYDALQTGAFSLANAWLTGSLKKIDIHVIGEQQSESFTEAVRKLLLD